MANDIPTRARQVVRARQLDQCCRCGSRYAELHHRQRRREGGHGYENLVGLCSSDHRAVHASPEQSERDGYIVPVSVRDIWTVPIRTFMGWVLFIPDGSIVLLEQNVGADALEWHHANASALVERFNNGEDLLVARL